MIAIPRRYEAAFRERYRELVHAFELVTPHDRTEARFVAAQWITWLEARNALTAAMDHPDFPNLNTTERKEVRALRRHCFIMARAYQAAMSKLTTRPRRALAQSPQSGEQLAVAANGSGLYRPDKTKKKDKP